MVVYLLDGTANIHYMHKGIHVCARLQRWLIATAIVLGSRCGLLLVLERYPLLGQLRGKVETLLRLVQ